MLGPESVRLDGKVALVTGAAVGIGESVALALASFGADLALCDRDEGNLSKTVGDIEETGRSALAMTLDVRDREAVYSFVEGIGLRFGHVDIVVNNAGGGFQASFEDISTRGQDALVAENFSSVTHVVRAALPLMGAGGSIINITSIEAHRAAPGYAVYTAMKAAVASLTKTLALELGGRGIRVNCIAPDVIPTPGIGDIPYEPRTPLVRRGSADDVAGAVVFLAGELAGFVTGATLHVDGGNLAAGGWRRREDGTFTT